MPNPLQLAKVTAAVVGRISPAAEAALKEAVPNALGAAERLAAEAWPSSWDGALKVLKDYGQSTAKALGLAARDSRVVGIGDLHIDQVTNHVGSLMPTLSKNGLTHLGIEVPAVTRPIFDQFNAGKSALELPAHLNGEGGAAALKWLHQVKVLRPDVLEAWTKARDASLKLVPLDANTNLGAAGREMFIRDASRDLLGADAKTRLGLWFGNLHLADSGGAARIRSAGEMLRFDAAMRGERMTTFGSIADATDPVIGASGTLPLTFAALKPTAVTTRNLDGSLNAIGRIGLQKSSAVPWIESGQRVHHFAYQPFDQLVVYPSPVRGRFPMNMSGADLAKLDATIDSKLAAVRQRSEASMISSATRKTASTAAIKDMSDDELTGLARLLLNPKRAKMRAQVTPKLAELGQYFGGF